MHVHIHKRTVIFIAGVLVLAIVALTIALFSTYTKVAPQQVINRDRLNQLVKDHIVLGPEDAGAIESWMTFDYINHVFGLPPQYLAQTLDVNDARYPNIAISKYARSMNIEGNMFVSQVQTAVRDYSAVPAGAAVQ